MTDRYPIPGYACNIWVAGDNLMVAFPGTVTEQGHTITLPISEGGLKTALTILQDRAKARSLLLGNSGTPTQWDAERLAAMAKALSRSREEKLEALAERKAEKAAKVAEADAFLKELGL